MIKKRKIAYINSDAYKYKTQLIFIYVVCCKIWIVYQNFFKDVNKLPFKFKSAVNISQ